MQSPTNPRGLLARRLGAMPVLALLASSSFPLVARAAVTAPVSGEIQSITINNMSDHWSGGTIVVGGTIVTIPRNLLLDLPANRVTLAQLYAEAPAACVAAGQTGLAKTDSCNTSGMGAIATISANYTTNNNVIAGDVLIQKGVESIIGTITFINYAEGWFRLNGAAGDGTTGVMVRLNDPDGRHTHQVGAGCAGGPNCSADPRFTLDADNYTNTFSSGYPWCIPSTVSRTFADRLGLGTTTARANADGSGDVLCPQTNRPGGGLPAADSRRFAPVRVGDLLSAEGNFETVNGVRFLSAHSTMVLSQLTTNRNDPTQPDYLFIEEAFIDGPGFQNERARSLFIGFTTVAPADVLLWSIHYDPVNNAPHELPLGSTLGCDAADGAATCTGQGLIATGADIFRIRHDVDFLVGAKARLNPCSHLAADPRMGSNICPAGGATPDSILPQHLAEQFAILSPIPHEVMFRTGKKWASLQTGGTPLITLDVNGNEATNGEYLFPFGMNLGGIDVPNAFEFNLNAVNTPFSFSGIPWNLDRRLSPGGCIDTNGDGAPDCEGTPQPLDPFPWEGIDPRTQAAVPQTIYNDANFTSSPLSNTRNRILSYVTPAGRFDGNNTLLAWPPADPAAIAISPTPLLNLVCAPGTSVTPNAPPNAVSDSASTIAGTPVIIAVLANDSDPDGNPLTVSAISQGAHGTVTNNSSSVTYAPAAGFTGSDSFVVTISDGLGGTATSAVSVTVFATANTAPVANPDVASAAFNTAVTVAVLANDLDANGDPLAVTSVANGTSGTVSTNGTTVTYTPNAGFTGADSFTYTVSDGRGGSAAGLVSVNVGASETLGLALALFRSPSEWSVSGTTSVLDATITIYSGPTTGGTVIGTANAVGGLWTFQNTGSAVPSSTSISIASSGGAALLNQTVTIR